jgi:E3 ubiquitin-protein ligase TRIP12
VPISSFIASLLGAKEADVASCALRLAEILMDKLPDVFSGYFLKEGVAHAIDQLAAAAPTAAAAAPAAGAAAPRDGKGKAVKEKDAKGKPARRSSSRNKGKVWPPVLPSHRLCVRLCLDHPGCCPVT